MAKRKSAKKKPTFKFIRPSLKVCPQRTTRFEPATDSPILWLQRALPSEYKAVDFDGYVVTGNNVVSKLLLLREFVITDTDNFKITDLIEEVKSDFGLWPYRKALADILDVDIDIVLCPYKYPADRTNGNSLFYVSNAQDSQQSNHVEIGFMDLQKKIKELRGFEFSNVKPLNAAKTYLECALANSSKNPWPGDLDGIIMRGMQPICLLEFKTHNLRTPISKEHIGKYGQQDWRRFHVLFTLQNVLNDVPIVFVVWGPRHSDVKIDIISAPQTIDKTILTTKDYEVFTKDLISLVES